MPALFSAEAKAERVIVGLGIEIDPDAPLLVPEGSGAAGMEDCKTGVTSRVPSID
jgi:hypothetical protein